MTHHHSHHHRTTHHYHIQGEYTGSQYKELIRHNILSLKGQICFSIPFLCCVCCCMGIMALIFLVGIICIIFAIPLCLILCFFSISQLKKEKILLEEINDDDLFYIEADKVNNGIWIFRRIEKIEKMKKMNKEKNEFNNFSEKKEENEENNLNNIVVSE